MNGDELIGRITQLMATEQKVEMSESLDLLNELLEKHHCPSCDESSCSDPTVMTSSEYDSWTKGQNTNP